MKRNLPINLENQSDDSAQGLVKIGQAAKTIGVSIDTLRRWERAGKIRVVRTPGGTRLYSLESLKGINRPSAALENPKSVQNPKEEPFSQPEISTAKILEQKSQNTPLRDLNQIHSLITEEWNKRTYPFTDNSVSEPHPSQSYFPQTEKLDEKTAEIITVNMRQATADTTVPLSEFEAIFSKIYAKIYARTYALLLIIITGSMILSGVIFGSYLVFPSQTKTAFSPDRKANIGLKLVSASLSPFNGLSTLAIKSFLPEQAKKIGLLSTTDLTLTHLSDDNVLAAENTSHILQINTDTSITNNLTVEGQSVFKDTITAPNVIYGLVAGNNITITQGQNPTISANIPTIPDLVANLTGTSVSTTLGGTGVTTYTKGDILYASDTNTLTKLAIGSQGKVLKVSSDGVPSWDTDNTGGGGSGTFNSFTLAGTSGTSQTVSDGNTVTIASDNGITTTAASGPKITVGLNLAAVGVAATSTTSSGSGLEVASTGLTLLRGCTDGQLLKWDATNRQWSCGTDLGGGSAVVNIQEGGVGVGSNISTINFNATDFNVVNSAAGVDTISLDYASNHITQYDGSYTISGVWTFSQGINSTAIGNSSASTGAFTTLAASSTVTLTGLGTGSGTQLCIDGSNNVISCATGSGGVTGSGTINRIPKFSVSTTNVGDSSISDDGSTVTINSEAFTASGGTVNLNNSGTAATIIGNASAGALTFASGSNSSFAVTGANLTFSTLSSGTLALNSAGALNLTAAGNSVWSTGSNTLTLTSSNFNVSSAGLVTLAGGQSPDITSAVAAGVGSSIGIKPGTSTGASTNGAAVTISGGDGSGTTSVIGGALTLQGGSATGGSGTRTGGAVTIDSGYGGSAGNNGGAVAIGATNAASIGLGRSGITTTVTGGLTQQTGAVTLNATGSNNTNINATNSTGLVNIGNSSGGALTLASGAASSFSVSGNDLTLSTVTSGNLALSSAASVNITGNANSVFDLGSAHTLSLQTTNNGPITTGTGLFTLGGDLTFSGTSGRTITGPTSGGLTITDAGGNIAISTTGSGNLSLSSAGQINITGTNGQTNTWNFGTGNLVLSANNINADANGIQNTAIGATTRSTGAFTTLAANSTVTLSGLSPSSGSQLCLDASNHVVTCSAGSGVTGSGTQNVLTKWSNVAGTQIGDSSITDTSSTFSFAKEIDKTIQIADSTSANTAGATLTVLGAAGGATNAAGGRVNITGGAAAGNGTGGILSLTSGAAGTTGTGGALNITSGVGGASSGASGAITIRSGTAASGANTGSVTITTGNASGGGNSGNLSLDVGSIGAGTAGTVSIAGSNASSLALGRSGATFTLASSNLNVSNTGVITLAGNLTADITTATASTANAITFQPGVSNGASGTGATLNLLGGTQSGSSSIGGSVAIDAGTGTSTNGSVTIGTATAASIALGRSGITTTITGATTLAPNTAQALTINQYGTGAGQTGELRLMEGGASSTQYTGFKAPDGLSANLIMTLPADTGGSNYVLTTDGSGVLSWTATGAGGVGGSVTQITAADGLGTASGTQGGNITTSGSLYIVTSPAAAASTATQHSGSGLEFDASNRLTLIRGCSDNNLLTWDDTAKEWKCNSVSGVGSISGSGASGQISYWSGLSSVTGNNNFTFSAAPATGDSFSLTNASFAPAGGATGNLANLTFTNGSTNTSGVATTTGLNIAATNNAAGGGGTQNTYGIRIQDLSGTSGAGTQNNYGIRIGNQGLASTENSYGLYVDAQSGSTNNYAAIFAGGRVGIGTSTPSDTLDLNGALYLEPIAAPGTTTNRLYNIAGTLTWDGADVCVSGGPCASTGTVGINGTPVAGQIAYWATATDIKGNANYTVSDSTLSVAQATSETTGIGYSLTATSLTTGSALSVTGTNTDTANTAGGVTQNVFNVTNAQSTTALTNGFVGLGVNFTDNPSVAGNTEYAARIQNQLTGNTTDNAVSALLLLDNADTNASGSTVVTDALRITNSGAIAGGITNGITIGTGTDSITNGLVFGSTGITTDITLQNGATIDNNTSGTITLTAGTAVNLASAALQTAGTTRLSNGGALSNITGYTQGSGNFDMSGSSGTFATGTGAVNVNGDTTIAAGKSLSLASGAGTITQTYTTGTDGNTGATFNATNSASSGTVAVNGLKIALAGTNNGTGTNTINGINFAAVTTRTNNTFNGLFFPSSNNYDNYLSTPTIKITGAGAITGATGISTTTLNTSSTVTLTGILGPSAGSQLCLDASNIVVTCAAGSGGVTSANGTTNKLPKYTGAQALGDSSVLDTASNFTFDKEVAKTIGIADTTSSNTAGSLLTILGAAGNGSGAGGALAFTGGAGGATGAGGAISVITGAGGATSGTSGSLTLATGTAASNANTGSITIQSGNAAGSGNSGSLTIDSGSISSGTAGTLSLGTANASAISIGHSGITTAVNSPFTASSGTVNLNNSGTAATTIGNASAGALTLASGAASSFSVTGNNLTLSTLSSGTLALNSAGAINLAGNANSTFDFGSGHTLNIQTTNNGPITTGTGLFTQGGDFTFSGTSARTITGPGTGGLTINDTSGNLTLSTTTSGAIALNSAGNFSFSGTRASLSTGGVLSLVGGQTQDITSLVAAGVGGNLTVQPGTTTTASGAGATLTIKAGNESGNGSTGGALTLQGGDSTGGSGTLTGGAVSIDSGSGTSAGGAITIGASNAASLGLGRSGITTTITGSTVLSPSSAGALTINQFNTTAGNTGELRFMEGGAGSTQYTGFKAPDSLTTNKIYTLPNYDTTPPSNNYVLTWTTGDQLVWQSLSGAGAGGDITAVGDVSTGAAFTLHGSGNNLYFNNGGNSGDITAASLSSDQTYTLPDLSGTFLFLDPSTAQADSTTSTAINISKTGVGALAALSQTSAITANYTTNDVTVTRGLTSATASVTNGGNLLTLANSSTLTGASSVNNPTGILISNATGASGALYTGNYVDFQRADSAGGALVSKFSVNATGNITMAGGITAATSSNTINNLIINSGVISGTLTTLTPSGAFTVGATSQNLTLQGAATSISSTNAGNTSTLSFATPTGTNTLTVPDNSGTLLLLGSSAVQTDNSSNASIFINDTAGGNLLQLQRSGTNRFLVDNSGNLTIAPVAATTGSPSVLTITGPSDTTLTAATEATDVNFNLARTVQFTGNASAGAANITTQRAISVLAPTYSFSSSGAQTITNGTTFALSGAPSGGTNATITNSSALRISSPTLANVTNGYGLYVDAPAGATNNYAATFASGNVGIGTTSPTEALDINGRIHLAQVSAPVTTTDKLYNVGGSLVWAGSNVCLASGNCTGAGGGSGVTYTSQTQNRLTKFTNNTGEITSSQLSDDGTTVSISNSSLTTASLFSLTATSTPTSAASTSNGAILNLTEAAGTNATTYTGLDLQFTSNPTVAGNTEYVQRIQNQATTNTTDNAVSALLLLDNADTNATGSTVVTDALRITNSGGISNGITNGLNFASTTIATGINFSSTPASNYISGSNFSVTAAGAETLASSLQATNATFTNTTNQIALGTTNVLTISASAPTGSQTLTIPSISGADTICLQNAGNCTGAGGGAGVTYTSQTQNHLTKFTSTTGQIASSQVVDDGTTVSISNTGLTTASLLSLSATSTPTAVSSTSNGATFSFTEAAGTNATTYTGLDLQFTSNPTVAGNTEYAARIQNQATSNTTDNAVSALLLLDNADTNSSGSTVVTDALRITNSGAIAAGITNGINLASTTIDTGIKFSAVPTTSLVDAGSSVWTITAAGAETLGSNLTVRGTTLSLGNGSASTISTPSGNANLSIIPNGSGALSLATTNTGNVSIGNSTGSFTLTSSGFNVSGGALTGVSTLDTISTSNTALGFAGAGTISSGAGGSLNITSDTTGALTLDSSTTGAVNIGNGANAKAITLGNTSGATSLAVNTGTGGVTLANGDTTNGTVFKTNTSTDDKLALLPHVGGSNSFTATISSDDLTANTTYLLPEIGGGTTTICTTSSACASVGSVTDNTPGSNHQIAFFTSTSHDITGNSDFLFNNSNTGTGTSSNFVLSNTALTTGTNFYIAGTSTDTANTAGGVTQNLFDVTNAQSTAALTNGFIGLGVNFTNNPSVAGNTEYAFRIQNQVTTNTTDNAVSALLLLDNADTNATGSTVVTDALRITNSGAISAGISNGVTFGSATIDNGLNFSATPATKYVNGTNWNITAAGAETLASTLQATQGTFTAASGLTLGTASSTTGAILLKNGSNGNTLTLQSGATGSDLTFTLPTADGANGDCLKTNSSGVLSFSSCGGGGAGTVTDTTATNTAGLVAFFSGTANDITNTANFAWTNTAGSNGLAITSDVTTSGSGTGFALTANSLTTGTAQSITSSTQAITSGSLFSASLTSSSATAAFTGNVGGFSATRTNATASQSLTDSGSILGLTRSETVNASGATTTISGNVLNISDTGTATSGTLTWTGATASLTRNCSGAGTCSDSGNVLSLTQSYSSASGDVLSLSNAGTGNAISLAGAGTRSINSTSGNLTLSTTTSGTLSVTSAGTLALSTSGGNNNITVAPNGTGSVRFTSGVTTGTGTSSGLSLASSTLQNGHLAEIASTSTAGTGSDNSYLLYLTSSGTNSNNAHTSYGLYSTVTNTNATSGTNIAGYFSASGATTANYALIVPSGGGSVGIGTSTPSDLLDVSGSGSAIRLTDTGASNSMFRINNTYPVANLPRTIFQGGQSSSDLNWSLRFADFYSSSSTNIASGIQISTNNDSTYTNANTLSLFMTDSNAIINTIAGSSSNGLPIRIQSAASSSYTTPNLYLDTVANGDLVGIRTTSPGAVLDIVSGASSTVPSFRIRGTQQSGDGSNAASSFLDVQGAVGQANSGTGGASAGAGGAAFITGGTGGAETGGSGTNTGGAGGAISLTGGTGGNATSGNGGAGGNITLTAGSAGTGGNANGGTLTLNPGAITGSGTSSLNIGTSNATSIALGRNGATLTIASSGSSSWTNTSGNLSLATATSGTINLNPLGSSTGNVVIGTGSSSTTPDLLVLDNKSDSGDPTGTPGAMYYNANSNKFRCYENGSWGNCIASGTVVHLNDIALANGTNTIDNTNYAQVWNWSTLNTETALTLGGGTGMTTGSVLALGPATYNHGNTNETGSLASISFTDATNGTATSTTNGLNIGSTVNVTTGASGTKTINPINIAAPTLTACSGGSSCIWNGALISTQSTGAAAAITQNGLNIAAAGVSAGTLNGINVGSITAGSGTETALNIGNNWDTGIAIGTFGTSSQSSTGISIGNISSTGTNNRGISLGTLTGATSTNYQLATGAVTAIASATNAQLNLGGVTGTAASSTNYGINIGNLDSTGTSNTGINLGNLSAATTSKGVVIGTLSSATSVGLQIGALSGTTADTGISVGAISGSGATGTGISVGNISTTGANNAGISLGTLTGGSSTNRQIFADQITAVASATNTGLSLNGSGTFITGTAASSSNRGIHIGTIASTGTLNTGIDIGTITGNATTDTGLNIGAISGNGTNNYGINIAAISGATNNYAINTAQGQVNFADNSNSVPSLQATNNTITTLGAGINTTGMINFQSTSLTTGNLLNLQEAANALTTGTLLNVSTTSTALAGTAITGHGMLGNFEWNPGSSATVTGDLFRIAVGSNASVSGNIFDIVSGSSSLFSINPQQLTASVPANFTSPGDVSVAYDINFTNPTASYIKSFAPITIASGDTFNSSYLTLKTYNEGAIVFDTANTTSTAVDLTNSTLTSGTGINAEFDGLTTGTGLNLNSTGTITSGGQLESITANSATTGNLLTVTGNGLTTGTAVSVSSTGTITSGGQLMSLTANSATTGNLLTLSGTGLTTGNGISLTTSGLTTGKGLSILGPTGTSFTTGSLLSLCGTTNSTGCATAFAMAPGSGATGSGATLSISDRSSNTSGASTVNGLNIAATVNTTGSTGTKAINGINLSAPTFTGCTGGTCQYTGLNIGATAPTSQISAFGIQVAGATAPASSSITGISVAGITAGSGTETGVSIGAGWDTGLSISQNATGQALSIAATAAPTSTLASISNSGQATTSSISGLGITLTTTTDSGSDTVNGISLALTPAGDGSATDAFNGINMSISGTASSDFVALNVGAVAGSDDIKGINIGNFSGATTATYFSTGALSNTGATAYQLSLGASSSISGANATEHGDILAGNISGTTPAAFGIKLGTLTGGTSTNYQLTTGAVTAIASATNAQLNLGGVTGTAASSTNYGINIGNLDSTGTLNTGINVGNLSGATTSKGVVVGTLSSATSVGLQVGALSGTTADTGISVGAISGSGATGTGISVGNISTTGTTNIGLNLGTITGGTVSQWQIATGNMTGIAGSVGNIQLGLGSTSGSAAGGSTNATITGGNVSITGGTNYGISLGTLTGGATSNYQLSTGAVTAVASATNAQLNLGGVTGTAASSTNYGIKTGTMNSTGTANYGVFIDAVSGATNNYGLVVSGTPASTATSSLAQLGTTAISGGSANGTYLATNAGASFAGDFANYEQNNISLWEMSSVANAVNGAKLTFAATGNTPTLALQGSDSNIGLTINPKGTGVFTINSGVTSGTGTTAGINLTSTSLTSGNLVDINTDSANTLTTGNVLKVSSTATSLTTGSLLALDYSPSSTSATGDLFSLNIGSGASAFSGNLFNLKNNGSSVFSVSQTTVTSALPFNETAAGDLSVAYDLNFTNPTASYIKSAAPLTIASGETFNSSDLNLTTYNSGNIVLNMSSSGSVLIPTLTGVNIGASSTPTRTLDVTGTIGGNVVTTTTSDSSTTSTIATRALAYYVESTDTAGDCNTSDKTFNITGLSNTEGSFAFISSRATDNNCTSNSVDVTVQINGSTIGTVTAANTVNGSVIENYTVAYINSSWRIVGLNSGTAQGANGSDSADLAEWTLFSGDKPQPGDVVVMSTEGLHLQKSAKVYDGSVIGIISTAPFQTMGHEGPDSVQLALNGRVPTRVSSENGPIKAGDYLTTSSTPGVAMKATRPGPTVGKAMEDFTSQGTGTITAFINVSFADPQEALANLTVATDGSLAVPAATVNKLNISGANASLTVNGTSIDAATLTQAGQLASAFGTLQNQYQTLADSITNLQNAQATQSAQIADVTQKVASSSAQISDLSDKTASNSAALSDLKASLDKLMGNQASSSAEVANGLSPVDALLATQSATLADLKVDNSISTLKLDTQDATISGTLKSLGDTSLGNTTIAGDLTVDGTFSITDGNTINAFPTLHFQSSPMAEGVDFFNGLVSIDKYGKVIAQEITTNKLTITATKPANASADPTIGTATITAGQTEIPIVNNQVTQNSKIFVTPRSQTGGQALIVSGVVDNTGFVVSLDHALNKDVTFDWWIVDTK